MQKKRIYFVKVKDLQKRKQKEEKFEGELYERFQYEYIWLIGLILFLSGGMGGGGRGKVIAGRYNWL